MGTLGTPVARSKTRIYHPEGTRTRRVRLSRTELLVRPGDSRKMAGINWTRRAVGVGVFRLHHKPVASHTASKSKSRNTPFHGTPVVGRAMATIVGGAVKM